MGGRSYNQEMTDPKTGPPGATDAEERVKVVDRRWWAQPEGTPADSEPVAARPAYVEELEQRLAERDRQLQQYVQQFKTASAEFDEARVRARREVGREIERSKRAMLGELLDVADNLDRAIDAASTSTSIDAIAEGVKLVRSQFLARLQGFGVVPIDALGQRFDPALHEAVTTIPAGSDADDDAVLGVVRQGFRIGDDVLRPAQVAVGRKPEASE